MKQGILLNFKWMSEHLWNVFLSQPLLAINMQLTVFTETNFSSDAVLERVKLELFQNIYSI